MHNQSVEKNWRLFYTVDRSTLSIWKHNRQAIYFPVFPWCDSHFGYPRSPICTRTCCPFQQFQLLRYYIRAHVEVQLIKWNMNTYATILMKSVSIVSIFCSSSIHPLINRLFSSRQLQIIFLYNQQNMD